jgi:hypothetical protein
VTERDALEVAAWLAVLGVVASASAGLLLTLPRGAASHRVQGWIRVAAIVAGAAYVLVGVVAFAVILS